MDAVLGLDDPVLVHPEFTRELARARMDQLSETTGLDAATATVLSEDLGAVNQVTDERLAALVDDGRLTQTEAVAAGKAIAVYQIVDERPELAGQLSGSLGQVSELAQLDQAGWVNAIQASGATPPGGLDDEAWAGLLVRKVERLFPTQALHARLSPIEPADLHRSTAALARLRDANPTGGLIAAADFTALHTDDIPAAELTAIRDTYQAAVALAAAYPGQHLATLLDDRDRPPTEIVAEVTRRVGLVDRFLADNQAAMHLDLTAGSDDLNELTFDPGTSQDDQAGVLATVRAYQRMDTITGDTGAAARMVAAGYHGAVMLAAATPEEIGAATGLPQAMVRDWHDDATTMATETGLHLGGLLDLFQGDLNLTEVGNQKSSDPGLPQGDSRLRRPVRFPELLPLHPLPLHPRTRRVSVRPARLRRRHRHQNPLHYPTEPPAGSAQPPSRPVQPGTHLREHQQGAALPERDQRSPGKRDRSGQRLHGRHTKPGRGRSIGVRADPDDHSGQLPAAVPPPTGRTD